MYEIFKVLYIFVDSTFMFENFFAKMRRPCPRGRPPRRAIRADARAERADSTQSRVYPFLLYRMKTNGIGKK